MESAVLAGQGHPYHHCPNLDAFALASALHLTKQSDCPTVHSSAQMRSERLASKGAEIPLPPDHNPIAAQFIDLAREITHSPFPKRLRSVTWPSDPLLSESAMNQTGATGKGAADWRLKFRGGSFAGAFLGPLPYCFYIRW